MALISSMPKEAQEVISSINGFFRDRYKLIIGESKCHVLSAKATGIIFYREIRGKGIWMWKKHKELGFITNSRTFHYSSPDRKKVVTFLEIPAGMAKRDEKVLDAAIREFEEETGLITNPENMRLLTHHSDEFLENAGPVEYFVYLCTAFAQGKQNLDVGEKIGEDIIWIEESEVRARLRAYANSSEYFWNGLDLDKFSEYSLYLYFFQGKNGKL